MTPNKRFIRGITILAFTVAALVAAACEFRPPGRSFAEFELTSPRTVQFVITSNDLLPNQDLRLYAMGYRSYAPLLDHRRRIVANSWVRGATLWGPILTDLRLSWDDCQENEVSLTGIGIPCTAVTSRNQDRIEFGWRSVSSPRPDVARTDALNKAHSRDILYIPTAIFTRSGEGLSLASPGGDVVADHMS